MSSNTVHVVAHFVASPGKVDALKALLRAAIEPTRAESGCLQYDLLQSSDAPERLTFVERWKTAADFEGHLARPHIKAVLDQLPGLIDGDPEIRTYAQVV